MIFAVPYFRSEGGKWMDAADEIIIEYTDNSEESFVKFLTEHSDKRIIIDILDFDTLKATGMICMFRDLKEKHNLTNWALRFNVSSNRIGEVEQHLAEAKFSGFKDDKRKNDYFYRLYLETFEQLDRFLYMSVSDIYLTNALAFDLIRVKEKLEYCEFPPKIRIHPNICQSYWGDEISARSFFVRPEDVPVYEGYVDVMELYAQTLEQLKAVNVYFDIYKDGTWMGDLKEYLIGCKDSIQNIHLTEIFGKRRLGCRKRCVENGACRYCYDLALLSNMARETSSKIYKMTAGMPIEEVEVFEDESIQSYIGEETIDGNGEESSEEHSNQLEEDSSTI